MKKKGKKVIIGCLAVAILLGGYMLIQFNQFRYTVVDDEVKVPFINNLSMVHIYPNLQYLWIGNNYGNERIEGLDSLSNLKHLSFDGASFTKIEGLDNLHNLESLTFRMNKIEKIEGLSGLNHLQTLDLSYNQITTIENIEQVPLIKNDYCYTFEIPKEEYLTYSVNSIQDGRYYAEDCFVEEVPDNYIDKYLYSDDFEYGETISPLSKSARGGDWVVSGYISLKGNPITSITQESYDYINKYKIDVSLDTPLSSLEII